MRRRRGVMGLNGGAGIPVITATATGNPLTFETDLARPLKSLEIPFTPIQSGSGDPSPTNVRPISGWNATTINHTGANLLNGTTAANILKTGKPSQVSLDEDTDGKYVRLMGMSGTDVNLTKTLKFKENTRYTIILTGKNESSGVSSTHIRFVYSDGNSAEIDWSNPTEIKTIAVTSAANKTVKAITTLTRSYNTRIYYEKPFGIFEGVVPASSFEEYQGQSILVSFTDPSTGGPMTVYGGTLTLNEDRSADLVADREYKRYTGENSERWAYSSWTHQNNAVFYSNVQVRGAKYTERNYNYIKNCNMLPIITYNELNNQDIAGITITGGTTGFPSIGIPKSVLSTVDVAGLTSYLSANPLDIIYELATPITYHFDNVGQFTTFIGTNNIWTDTNGMNTATYLKHQS